jgi:hypothetical protein
MFPLLLLLWLAAARVHGFADFYCGDASCYEVLGVSRDASPDAIRSAYKTLSLQFHPDKQGVTGMDVTVAKERYLMVRQAYDTIGDSDRRATYDYILSHPGSHWENYSRYASCCHAAVCVCVAPVIIEALSFPCCGVIRWTAHIVCFFIILLLAGIMPKT